MNPARFPRALAKSAHIDQEAVETACAALAVNVLKGAVVPCVTPLRR